VITNQRQYLNTRARAEKFRVAAEQAHSAGPRDGVDPRVHAGMVDAMESEASDLRRQARRYERLKDGRVTKRKLRGLSELPDALIEARIARNWTQADLASRLGVAEQQVQRYEHDRYRSVGFSRIVEIANVLGIKIDSAVALPSHGPRKPRAKAARKTAKHATPDTIDAVHDDKPAKRRVRAKGRKKVH
jgi:HTH-type transcriptional regulator / antitoxin HigA